jgi:hypothetical protein
MKPAILIVNDDPQVLRGRRNGYMPEVRRSPPTNDAVVLEDLG